MGGVGRLLLRQAAARARGPVGDLGPECGGSVLGEERRGGYRTEVRITQQRVAARKRPALGFGEQMNRRRGAPAQRSHVPPLDDAEDQRHGESADEAGGIDTT